MDAEVVVGRIVPAVAFLVMLLVGSDVTRKDLRHPGVSPRSILVCSLAQLFCLPLIAVLVVALLNPPPVAAAGILLIGLSPSGTLSNFYAYLGRQRVVLSICLTAASALMFALAFPVLALLMLRAAPVPLQLPMLPSRPPNLRLRDTVSPHALSPPRGRWSALVVPGEDLLLERREEPERKRGCDLASRSPVSTEGPSRTGGRPGLTECPER